MLRSAKILFSSLLSLTLFACSSAGKRAIERDLPTPELYRAAGLGDLQTLAKANDAQIKNANHLGTTLLMVAARRNRLNSVEYLLSRGATANAFDLHKQTVLHYALPVKNSLMNSILLNAGGDPSVEDMFGVVPALLWAEGGNLDSLLIGLQNKEKWCCFAQIKDDLKQILELAQSRRKYIPPTMFLVLKELE